jgi:hypothetical protein
MLSVCLCAVTNRRDEAFEGDSAAVGEAGGERLLLHEVGEDSGIGCQSGEGEAEVLVDGNNFLLVGGKLFRVALDIALTMKSICEIKKTGKKYL